MAQPSTKLDSSLKRTDSTIQKDMADLLRRLKKPGHKSRLYDQRQSYPKQSAGLLESTKPTDPTAVTEGTDGAFGEFLLRKATSSRKHICLPCKSGKLIVRNLLSRHCLVNNPIT
jgi:hypothetical protein